MTARSDDYKRGYSHGYNTGVSGKWPTHKPPVPPDPVLSAIITAAKNLRDATDGELGKFDEGDEIAVLLGPYIDRFDDAMLKLDDWIKERESQ